MKKIAYITFCVLFWSCRDVSISKPQTTDKGQERTNEIIKLQRDNMPEILFENKSHNFGDVKQGEQVNYTFHFKNAGKSDLIVDTVVPSCDCTISSFPKGPMKVGEKGDITATLDTKNKNGEVITHLIVRANTYPFQTILTINANVVNEKR